MSGTPSAGHTFPAARKPRWTMKGLLRNSKTHALRENESWISVKILSFFIFKKTQSGHS